ncbi:MAG TPA: glycerol-3-phosphate 1-O-acyltransferase [Halieaceae bacterium]|nr:glycerol-3-phosphate 1-O-acyltransferase [Halieaceae bacterium]
MGSNPWQSLRAGRAIVIIDAAHRVERRLLDRWLEERLAEHGCQATIERVVMRIARRPEHLDAIPLEPMLGSTADDVVVLPLRVVWRSSLHAKTTRPRPRDLLFGNPRRPGAWRAKRILAQHPDRAVCIAGEPATLGDLRERLVQRDGAAPQPRQLAEFIAAQAGLALDIAERRLQGSRYKVPRRVAQNLQASPRFRAALAELSEETGRPVAQLRQESEVIMRELVARPAPFWLDVMAQLNHLIMSLGYDTEVVIDREGLERIRQLVRENPAALLWTHKTHVDGFAVNSMLFDNDFPNPHILGGVNMAFAGLGFLARRAGAIFIRRSFKGDPLYKLVLRHYIGYLMDKRFPLSWAFEGTRSRVGKLMPPRYGLLKYVMESAHATDARNLHIIPIAINYDLIGDVRDYAVEQAGATKQPESLRWFIGYLRGLRQPMGQIYFDFGEPVVLPEVPSVEDERELQKVAFRVGLEVNRVTPITLPALLCMVLLGAAPRALTSDELLAELRALVAWARERGIRLASHLDLDDEARLDLIVDKMIANGVLTRYDDGPERVYAIASEQHGVASYYRNSIAHFFVDKAIAELALMRMAFRKLAGAEAFWSEAERLRDFFKFEFFYAPREEFRVNIAGELARYRPDWEARLEDEGGAGQVLDGFGPLVAHSTMLPYIEAYRVVADVLARQPAGGALEERDCVQQSLAYGHQAYLQRRISSEASIGKLLFSNGFKLMANFGLTEAGDSARGEARLALAQEFRTLQRRVERIRAAALP